LKICNAVFYFEEYILFTEETETSGSHLITNPFVKTSAKRKRSDPAIEFLQRKFEREADL
jgi:hypothetical protein